MKTIGLIGGMSWESTVSYYRLINEGVKHALGGLHSARLMLYSVDFHDIEGLQRSADWDAAGALLADAARALERGGADCIVLCTNTMHTAAGRERCQRAAVRYHDHPCARGAKLGARHRLSKRVSGRDQGHLPKASRASALLQILRGPSAKLWERACARCLRSRPMQPSLVPQNQDKSHDEHQFRRFFVYKLFTRR